VISYHLFGIFAALLFILKFWTILLSREIPVMNKLFLEAITERCRTYIKESKITVQELSIRLGHRHKSGVINLLKSSRVGLFDLAKITYYIGNKEFVVADKRTKFKIILSDGTNPALIAEYENAFKNYDIFEGTNVTWRELGEAYGFTAPRTQAFQNWKLYDTPVMLVITAAYLCGHESLTFYSADKKGWLRLEFAF
jgi:hypothetical protein